MVWWWQASREQSMVSFHVDPQFGGLVFALFARHENATALQPANYMGSFNIPPTEWDSQLLTFAGTFGWEICRLANWWDNFINTVSWTGILVLFGFGSLAWYYRPRPPPSSRSLRPPFLSSPSSSRSSSSNHIYSSSTPWNTLATAAKSIWKKFERAEDDVLQDDEELLENWHGSYFGPGGGDTEKDRHLSDNGYHGDVSTSSSSKEEVCRTPDQDPAQANACNSYLSLVDDHKQILKSEGESEEDYLAVTTTPGGSAEVIHLYKRQNNGDSRTSQVNESWYNLQNNNAAIPWTPYSPERSASNNNEVFISSSRTYGSLLLRDSSLDSIPSDLSLDSLSLHDSMCHSTLAMFDKLQQELQGLKDNCLNMGDNIESLQSPAHQGYKHLTGEDDGNAHENEEKVDTDASPHHVDQKELYKTVSDIGPMSSGSDVDASTNSAAENLQWDSPFKGLTPPDDSTQNSSVKLNKSNTLPETPVPLWGNTLDAADSLDKSRPHSNTSEMEYEEGQLMGGMTTSNKEAPKASLETLSASTTSDSRSTIVVTSESTSTPPKTTEVIIPHIPPSNFPSGWNSEESGYVEGPISPNTAATSPNSDAVTNVATTEPRSPVIVAATLKHSDNDSILVRKHEEKPMSPDTVITSTSEEYKANDNIPENDEEATSFNISTVSNSEEHIADVAMSESGYADESAHTTAAISPNSESESNLIFENHSPSTPVIITSEVASDNLIELEVDSGNLIELGNTALLEDVSFSQEQEAQVPQTNDITTSNNLMDQEPSTIDDGDEVFDSLSEEPDLPFDSTVKYQEPSFPVPFSNQYNTSDEGVLSQINQQIVLESQGLEANKPNENEGEDPMRKSMNEEQKAIESIAQEDGRMDEGDKGNISLEMAHSNESMTDTPSEPNESSDSDVEEVPRIEGAESTRHKTMDTTVISECPLDKNGNGSQDMEHTENMTDTPSEPNKSCESDLEEVPRIEGAESTIHKTMDTTVISESSLDKNGNGSQDMEHKENMTDTPSETNESSDSDLEEVPRIEGAESTRHKTMDTTVISESPLDKNGNGSQDMEHTENGVEIGEGQTEAMGKRVNQHPKVTNNTSKESTNQDEVEKDTNSQKIGQKRESETEEAAGKKQRTSRNEGAEHEDEGGLRNENTSQDTEHKKEIEPPRQVSVIGVIRLPSVGEKVLISDYAATEWVATTAKGAIVRKGYAALEEEGMKYMRQIRGDNYCGLRASLFQALRMGIKLPSRHKCYNRIQQEMKKDPEHWLKYWSFGNRVILKEGQEVLELIDELLRNFDEKTKEVLDKPDNEKEDAAIHLLNSNEDVDVQLMEALKLHMMSECLELYDKVQKDEDLPIFAMLMFARDSSPTPKEFMVHHLNTVGNSGGLEQVEMCLLGHILSRSLKVLRPGSFGSYDFICYFPEIENGDTTNHLLIVAEDDRHYNVATE